MNDVSNMTDEREPERLAIPDYLERYYWWAYTRAWAVRFWDRPWLINLILYGYYDRLRDAALEELSDSYAGRILKISCCYGTLSSELGARVARAGGNLTIVDILPAQLENARRKTAGNAAVRVERMNASTLDFPDSSFDTVLLFFLLHEMPQDWRERTMVEAFRVLCPGGKLVIVDFGKPAWWHPFSYGYLQLLGTLEPFAIPMWRRELAEILPSAMNGRAWEKVSYFGGLFQKLSFRK